MSNETIVHAVCDMRHLRRLFHLHNQVIDRAILGFPSRSLRFIGTTGIDCSHQELNCSVARSRDDRHVSTESAVSTFSGIEFRSKDERQPVI
jgi:hypothetical protein